MNRHLGVLSVTLAALVVLPPLSAAAAEKPSPSALAEGNAAFAADLYDRLRERDGNLFFSPYGISTALAMTYAGARGQTKEEMAEVLYFPSEQAKLHRAFSELLSHMSGIQERGHVRLSIANSLWCQNDYPFLRSFLDSAKGHYSAGVHRVDFVKETEAARLAINAWVEEETEQKIKELIKRGILSPATVLVLCNAIYFKGDWACKFDERRTRVADFYTKPGKTVTVPMMTQTSDVKWRRFAEFNAFELPYAGDDLSMLVLLPTERDGLPELEELLTKNNIREWNSELARSKASKVTVELPKFKSTCEFELAEVLAAMGMPSAFRGADFSGMTGNRELFISNVIHKAFVDVNEEGTEAAAATAIAVKRGSVENVPVLRADHPFIFVVQERETGSILFMGRVADPTS